MPMLCEKSDTPSPRDTPGGPRGGIISTTIKVDSGLGLSRKFSANSNAKNKKIKPKSNKKE